MANVIIIFIAVFIASIVAGISGFGLGTTLMPVLAIFFSIPASIVVTSAVHLTNDLLKLFLLGKFARSSVVIRFTVTAIIGAVIGAYLLKITLMIPPLFTYSLFGSTHEVTVIRLIIGSSIFLFSLAHLFFFVRKKTRATKSIDQKYIPIGGVLSGFFGGLSGEQGMLRTFFLIRAGLEKKEFIATAAACSVSVDVARLITYVITMEKEVFSEVGSLYGLGIILPVIIISLSGSYIATKLIGKITTRFLHISIGVLLIVSALALILGVI